MSMEVKEKKEATPTQRVSKRWAELDEQYPIKKQDSVIIFKALEMLASGREVEECIKENIPTYNLPLLELFKELASAYKGEETPKKEIISPLNRVSKRWAELDEQYPINNQESAAIYNGLSMIAAGEEIESCIEKLPADNKRLIQLFKELAAAYRGEKMSD